MAQDPGNFRMDPEMREQLGEAVWDIRDAHRMDLKMSQIVRFCLEDNLGKTIKKLVEDKSYLDKKLQDEKATRAKRKAAKKAAK